MERMQDLDADPGRITGQIELHWPRTLVSPPIFAWNAAV